MCGAERVAASALWAQADNAPVAVAYLMQTAGPAITQASALDPTIATKFYTLPAGYRSLCLAPTLTADGVTTIDETDQFNRKRL